MTIVVYLGNWVHTGRRTGIYRQRQRAAKCLHVYAPEASLNHDIQWQLISAYTKNPDVASSLIGGEHRIVSVCVRIMG